MPQVTCEFVVENYPAHQDSYGGNVPLINVRDFWKIVSLGFPDRRLLEPGAPGGALTVKIDEQDPRLIEVLAILQRNGFSPSKHMVTPREERGHSFDVCRTRTYSRQEIESPRFLQLYPGYTRNAMAGWEGGSDDEGWIAKPSSRARKREIGHFDCLETILFGEKVKSLLEAKGLKGTALLSVRWHSKSAKAVPLWSFGHTCVLPPCLVPRQNDAGHLVTAGEVGGIYWDDAHPAELAFKQSQVAEMGEFDFAVTKEKIGSHLRMHHSAVVVSQRFRQTLEEAGIKTVEYAPVKLV